MKKSVNVLYFTTDTQQPISDFLDSLSAKQQVKLLRIFQLIEEYGTKAVVKYIKKVSGTPLWEIRVLGKDNIRAIYVYIQGNQILILHAFIKKRQKTAKKELKIALDRYRWWQEKKV